MLRLTEIKRNNDGTATYKWDADKEFEQYYKDQVGAETLDDKEIGEFIVNMIQSVCGESTPSSRVL